MGLPTPNVFAGGHEFHSAREWVTVQDMAAAAAVVVRLAGEWAGGDWRPAAVCFDNDGLLLDTESAWTRAEVALFGRHGRAFTDDHKRYLIGSSAQVAAAKLEEMLELPGRGAALWDELHDLVMEEAARGVAPLPGAVELVDALRAAGTPLALVSNSAREFVELALRDGRGARPLRRRLRARGRRRAQAGARPLPGRLRRARRRPGRVGGARGHRHRASRRCGPPACWRSACRRSPASRSRPPTWWPARWPIRPCTVHSGSE